MCFHVTPQDFSYMWFAPLVTFSEIDPAAVITLVYSTIDETIFNVFEAITYFFTMEVYMFRGESTSL